ncbi:hypothetical protein AB0L57_10485 [Nocardia sp. NPDC052254]|uniref:hypothetical protein n=1 Tax=Nocardia sp. NPDC052254 TaxID=3155681 RepID=UPI003448B60F
MSGELITATPAADVLVEEIIDRYGSIAQFCDVLRRDLDDPTVELPCIPVVSRPGQMRTAPPPPNRTAGTAVPPPARTAPAPPDFPVPPTVAPPPAAAAVPEAEAEAHRRRGFWRRFLDRWRS